MALSQVPPELMSQVPAGATPVDAIAAPAGGYWILGSDGGIFAVGGAPYLGAYTGESAATRNDPNRTFTKLISSGQYGYSAVTASNELYAYDDVKRVESEAAAEAARIAQDAATAAGLAASTEAGKQESSKIWFQGELGKMGLGELAGWALERYNKLGGTAGAGEAVMIEMRSQPLYLQKFPGMALRTKNGFSPITEKEYMDWKETARTLMRDAGLPEGFYDSDDDFADLIGNKNLSPVELKARVQDGFQAMMQSPVEARQEMQRLWGVGEGDLAAFFLDPEKGESLLTTRVTQAQIAGAAKQNSFKDITASEAERLQQQGVDSNKAAEGFGLLGEQSELLQGQAGEGGDITREQQLGSVAGNKGDQEAIKRRGKQRTATFDSGGGFAGGQEGVTGLGSA